MRISAFLFALGAATSVQAQVGEIGLTFGQNRASEIDSDDNASVAFGSLAASYGFALNNGMLLQFDANYRFDDFSGSDDFEDNENPETRYSVAAHALWPLGDNAMVGGFLYYGDTRAQDEVADENYDVAMIGVEARHFFADDLLGYAQLAYGKKVRDGDDDEEGFTSGGAVRLGAVYFMNERTSFTLDTEFAGTGSYVDGDDPGRFYALSIGGETWLNTAAPLAVTYSLAYSHTDATSEGTEVDEIEFGVGLKYTFGAGSAKEAWRNGKSLGTPQLPLRASAWTEFLD